MLDIKEYSGMRILDKLSEPLKKEIYSVNWEQLYINYGDNVDFQKLKRQVLLCDATINYLYSPPKALKYKRGSSPLLEKVVLNICGHCKNDREKVIALMCYCRDLYKKHGIQYKQLFFGGTEEELIKKGEWLCECLGGRLMPVLCEISGIPGRGVMHVASGHIVSELFFEDKWGYVDPRCGVFYLNTDGSFASVYELFCNRKIIKKQDNYVKSFVEPFWGYEARAKRNYEKCFHPNEIQVFTDYSIMDRNDYNYEWKTENAAERDGLYKINTIYSKLSDKLLIG